jgi:transcriptional regulator with XRE-family HTH domain
MSTDVSFGRIVRTRRRAMDMTQEVLARHVGYSVITIRKVEAGERRPSRQLAERLACTLRIEPHERPSFTALARARDGTVELPDEELGGGADLGQAYPPSNLPSPLTRLIGRQQEVAAARGALLRTDLRLITMVGPPGIGKSRLATRVAGTVQHAFPDGVWYVPL